MAGEADVLAAMVPGRAASAKPRPRRARRLEEIAEEIADVDVDAVASALAVEIGAEETGAEETGAAEGTEVAVETGAGAVRGEVRAMTTKAAAR